jgi:hypothetical protein
MTEDMYQAVIIAERAFGKIQVRQLTRKLATDLGLPADCMEPPKDPKPRPPRWFDDRLDAGYEADRQEVLRQHRLDQHVRLSLPDPRDLNASIKIASVA